MQQEFKDVMERTLLTSCTNDLMLSYEADPGRTCHAAVATVSNSSLGSFLDMSEGAVKVELQRRKSKANRREGRNSVDHCSCGRQG